MTVSDLLGTLASSEVVTADKDQKVFEVVETLKKHAISQLVIVDGDEVVGVVTEADLLRHMMTSTHSIVAPVSTIAVAGCLEVNPSTPLSDVSEAFASGARRIAVVRENGKLRAVITKIDLIEFMTDKFRE